MTNFRRVIAYIDGFNLYFGLIDQSWRHYLWLNLQALTQSLLAPDQQLLRTKYFTARVKGDHGKEQRQGMYLGALRTLKEFDIYFGHYRARYTHKCSKCGIESDVQFTCDHCGHVWKPNKEKKTDVNIATHMLCDAFRNRFDTAILISGDSDLIPPVEMIRQELPEKAVVVAFPPKRELDEWDQVATTCYHISEDKIRRSMFPTIVKTKRGTIITCPLEWRASPVVSAVTPTPQALNTAGTNT